MNTAMARMRADRIFYSAVPLAVAAMVFTGFARSWFLRPFGTLPAGYGPLTWLLVVHGTLFTLWMALAVTQPLLIASRNRALHRTLGYAGAGLATLMVLILPIVTIHSMRSGGVPAFPTIYLFASVNVIGILTFAVTMACVVAWRKRAEIHKRLALLALIPFIPPALGRTPGVDGFMPLSGFGGADLILLAGIVYDWRTRGKVHRVWTIGAPLTLVSQVAMFPLGFSAPWIAFSGWLMRLPV
jgi:hypothetical protein